MTTANYVVVPHDSARCGDYCYCRCMWCREMNRREDYIALGIA